MNLFSGFIAIKTAFVDNNFIAAGWFIVLGGIFDMFDGLMARITKSSSEFGVELDSLADVVTFGVGPSALVYQLYFHQFGGFGLLVSALPAICGALRLARFNVQLVGFDKDHFKGLPIPSSAIFIISYVTFFFVPHLGQTPDWHETVLWIVVIGSSLMMVSTFKYEAIPKFSKQGILDHPFKFGIFAAGIILIFVTKGAALFPLFALFILTGIVMSSAERIRRFIREGRPTALLDEEELAREEESTFGI